MRPGQNKRMRGRPNNNRRGPNPLTRSYESNGPDVKIRGNAQHVAEKYLQLARDAHTGGDPVAAENYLQHAEHYFRLIASAQAAQLAVQQGRPANENDYDDDDDDDGGVLADRFASPAERAQALAYVAPPPPLPQPTQPQAQFAPQPVVNAPAPYPFNERQPQPFDPDRPQPSERQNFQPRQDRRDGRPDRGPRPDRPDRQDRPREFRPYRDPNVPREPPPPPPPDGSPTGLPSFITAAPRIVAPPEEMEQPTVQADFFPLNVETPAPSEVSGPRGDDAAGDGRFPRGRRRRLRSPYGFAPQGHPDEGQAPATDEAPLPPPPLSE